MTGSCVKYSGQTYCWDDGIKTQISAGTAFHYSFWDISTDPATGSYGSCMGGCTDDFMNTKPTLMTANFEMTAEQQSFKSVAQMFLSGTPKSVTCALSSDQSTLDCADFSIDLNQRAL